MWLIHFRLDSVTLSLSSQQKEEEKLLLISKSWTNREISYTETLEDLKMQCVYTCWNSGHRIVEHTKKTRDWSAHGDEDL